MPDTGYECEPRRAVKMLNLRDVGLLVGNVLRDAGTERLDVGSLNTDIGNQI
jgi:hypothetical protein